MDAAMARSIYNSKFGRTNVAPLDKDNRVESECVNELRFNTTRRGIHMNRLKSLIVAVLLLTVGVIAPRTVRAQGNSEAAHLRQLNNTLLHLHGQINAAENSNGNSLHSQASAVIAERFAALQSLIQLDPMAALEVAFDSRLLASMTETFPASAAKFESHGNWTGPVDYIILDDATLTKHRVDLNMKVNNEIVKLHFKDNEPTWFKCNDILTVAGVRAGAEVAAADGNVSGSVAGANCTTLGDQKTVVILINRADNPATTAIDPVLLPAGATPTMLNDIYFQTGGRSVDGYWRDASYNKASASGVVVGPYTIPWHSCNTDYYNLRQAAINAADSQVNFTQYTRVMLIFAASDCGWAGLGTLGCSTLSSADGSFQASTSWNIAGQMQSIDNGVQLATHEGGHNLTLHHAATRYFTNATSGLAEPIGPIGTAGTHSEYGDRHSSMGSWNLGHYAAPHKQQIGWFAGSNVQTVETNGSFSIQPFENITSGVQALKVRRGTGNDAWFWLEFRQAIGLYDSTLGAQVRSGGLIHHTDASTGTYTHLLDFTPSTGNNFSDAAKLPGTGFYIDPYTNLTFSVDSITGTAPSSALNVTVNYGAVPCVTANPTVSITPSSLSGVAGAALNYTVNVTNNDTSGCTASNFALTTTLPSGWSTTMVGTLNIAPGSTSSTTMTKTIPASIGAGSNTVNATATRGANTATATATANVTVPPVAPTTTMNPIGGPFAKRATVPMSALSSIGGSSVVFTIVKPNGTTTKTVVAGSDGVASTSYKLSPKDPAGLYSVTARSTANGLQGPVSSYTATFTVQ